MAIHRQLVAKVKALLCDQIWQLLSHSYAYNGKEWFSVTYCPLVATCKYLLWCGVAVMASEGSNQESFPLKIVTYIVITTIMHGYL